MIFIIIDTFIFSLTGINITLFLMRIHFMDIISFIFSCLLLSIMNPNPFLIFSFFIMYLIDKILFKYAKFNLLMYISNFTFYYFIISNDLNSYFINLLLIILLYFYKYNYVGEAYERKKIHK